MATGYMISKALAERLLKDGDAPVRFNMSEYSDAQSVNKLIGAPAGYVGSDKNGLLTEAMKQNPHQVVVFDEIEKMHPDVLDAALALLAGATETKR